MLKPSSGQPNNVSARVVLSVSGSDGAASYPEAKPARGREDYPPFDSAAVKRYWDRLKDYKAKIDPIPEEKHARPSPSADDFDFACSRQWRDYYEEQYRNDPNA